MTTPEVVQLHDVITRLEARIQALESERVESVEEEGSPPTTRRHLLWTGVAALGGVAAATLPAGPAAALNGDPALLGVTNNAMTSRTKLSSVAGASGFTDSVVLEADGSTAVATNVHGALFTGRGANSGVRATGGANGGPGVITFGGTNGSGLTSTGGANGNGVTATGGTGNTLGVNATGTGTGSGVVGTGGSAAGTGVTAEGGASSGSGLSAEGGAPNGIGVAAQGTGTGTGVESVGGPDNGIGVRGTGGTSGGTGVAGIGTGSAPGVYASGGPSGAGIVAYGGSSGSGPGLHAQGGAGNGVAIVAQGTGTGEAIRLVPGAAGPHLLLQPKATAGPPLSGTHEVGEVWLDSVGAIWVCTAAAPDPGTWKQLLTDVPANPTPAGLVTLLPQPVRLLGAKLTAGARTVGVAGQQGIPADALGVVVTVSTAKPKKNGSVRVYPSGVAPVAGTPTLTYEKLANVALGATVRLGTGGAVVVGVSGGTTRVNLDATAYIR